MIKFLLMALLLGTVPALAEVDPQIEAQAKRSLNTEILRSPVYTKQLYRQRKEIDEAVAQKQKAYLQKRIDDKKVSADDKEAEQTRIKNMRIVDFGTEKMDLGKESPKIEKDPVDAFYKMATQPTVGGYGQNAEEKAQLSATDEAEFESQYGMTRAEYRALQTEPKKFGERAISLDTEKLTK